MKLLQTNLQMIVGKLTSATELGWQQSLKRKGKWAASASRRSFWKLRMLLKVFTPTIMTRMSMLGQRDNKFAFLGTEISKILIPVALKTSPSVARITEAKVKAEIASLLKTAPARKAARQTVCWVKVTLYVLCMLCLPYCYSFCILTVYTSTLTLAFTAFFKMHAS